MRSATQKNSKKSCERIFFLSLERVWRFSKLIFSPSFFRKKNNLIVLKHFIKQRFLCEFGASLEILQTLPNSLQTHKESDIINFFLKRGKNELENLQTLSKLKKICVHNFFFKKNMRAATQKKVVHAYSF